jgi:hypothetical protein
LRFGRIVAALVGGGCALLFAALLLSSLPANANTGPDRLGSDADSPHYGYTNHPMRASVGRTIDMYVERDFGVRERDHIVSAIRQWNYVLNGFVQFRARLLPPDASAETVSRLRQSGGWIIARVDSSHPIAHQGEGQHALAVTVGNTHSGVVYVISDRIGGRDLTGVIMHEFGHVLGAGHDGAGLMAPVYSSAGSHCIDRAAVAMVANAQRLPLSDLNWCVGPGRDAPPSVAGTRRAPMAWRPN